MGVGFKRCKRIFIIAWQFKYFWFDDLCYGLIHFILVPQFCSYYPSCLLFQFIPFCLSIYFFLRIKVFLLTSLFLCLRFSFLAFTATCCLLKKSFYWSLLCVPGTFTIFVVVLQQGIETNFLWFIVVVSFVFLLKLFFPLSCIFFGFCFISFLSICSILDM